MELQQEKTPLIMIPALLCNKKMYQHQIEALNEIADVTVPNIWKHDSIEAMAQEILDKAPETFAITGTSMGGYVAMEIVRQAPDRVVKLALINTRSGKDTEERLRQRQNAIDTATEETFLENVRKYSKMFVMPENDADGKLTDLMVDMAADVGLQGFINEQSAIIGRIDSTPFLKDIKCRTVLICGRNDTAIIDEMKAMKNLIPLSSFITIEQCAHLSPIEQPVAVSAVLRYWLG